MAWRAYGYYGAERLQMTIPGNETSFPFVNGGIFRMTTKKWPDRYVVVTDRQCDSDACDVHGKQGYPGDQGEFKFTQMGGHIYHISLKHWRGWYVCVTEEKKVQAGCKYNAYCATDWQIIPRSDGTVLLATYIYSGHGTKWYMYMEDGGDIQVTTNPDERAHFILSCDIQLKCASEDRCMMAAAAERKLAAHVEYSLDEQLEKLKQEMKSIIPLFTVGVKQTLLSQKDAMLTREFQFRNFDIDTIERRIRAVFRYVNDVQILDFINSTIASMISTLRHSTNSGAMHWHQHQIEKKVNDEVIGMEAHYKVMIEYYPMKRMASEERRALYSMYPDSWYEERDSVYNRGSRYNPKEETVVLIAFKVMAHTLDRAPDNSSSVAAAEINAMTHTLDREADNSDAGDSKSMAHTLDRAPDTSLNTDTAENIQPCLIL